MWTVGLFKTRCGAELILARINHLSAAHFPSYREPEEFANVANQETCAFALRRQKTVLSRPSLAGSDCSEREVWVLLASTRSNDRSGVVFRAAEKQPGVDFDFLHSHWSGLQRSAESRDADFDAERSKGPQP